MARRRFRRLGIWVLLIAGFAALILAVAGLPPGAVSFSQSTQALEAYDFVELTAQISPPRPRNPFTGAAMRGTFRMAGRDTVWQIDGFCDAEDGGVHRVRFMPSAPGEYTYSVEYRQGWWTQRSTGVFHVNDGRRRGPIRIDPQHRWHFIWEGTGEHYFWNGTTAYWLIGWRDDDVIHSSIERLHHLKINRLRVTVAGRTAEHYGEPVMSGERWTSLITPWPTEGTQRALHRVGRLGQVAGDRFGVGFGRALFDALAGLANPQDLYHPGFDYHRFDVPYWRKFERALRAARDRDMIVSLVLDMNDSRVHPAPASADEHRFIRYAVARFGAFSNITWDLGDDLDRYRDDNWTRATGTLIKSWDPYRHLATSHPVDNAHQDRTSDWFDFTSFQEWSREQHAFMLSQREEQQRLGRIIPQTNEEYGYEDHYPLWSQGPGSETADVLRRTAWDIAMAGAYQTTGETARRGTHVLPDTGGGWINGRGDDTMTMLQGYGHMVDFFTSFDWWRVEPHDELVDAGHYCLASPGELYAVYLPRGGTTTVQMAPGRYLVTQLNAATGVSSALPAIDVIGDSWTSPDVPSGDDWAYLLRRTASP